MLLLLNIGVKINELCIDDIIGDGEMTKKVEKEMSKRSFDFIIKNKIIF